ncbi:MAG: type II 3-dehydroquinate dehydratase [Clostridium sp.]|nr:type II 3-dehydroquinate dehydratase [Clostridium sp.]
MKKILVINGPNLNLLGLRQPEIYGRTSLAEIERALRQTFPKVNFEFFQSNSEGEIIDRLHREYVPLPEAAAERACGIIINPGAYSHTSLAIADALRSIDIPAVEVHISNIHSREEIRRHSLTAEACTGVIAGLGARGYILAAKYFIE